MLLKRFGNLVFFVKVFFFFFNLSHVLYGTDVIEAVARMVPSPPNKVGRCKLDPSLKAPGFQSLIVKRITLLST